MGRIWTSRQIEQDFAALCGCGGRFAGTESEARARDYLAERVAQATGCGVTRHAVRYRGWMRGEACIVLSDGSSLPAAGPGSHAVDASARTERDADRSLGGVRRTDMARAGAAMRGAIGAGAA